MFEWVISLGSPKKQAKRFEWGKGKTEQKTYNCDFEQFSLRESFDAAHHEQRGTIFKITPSSKKAT